MTGSTRTGAGLVTAVQTVHGAIAHPVLRHTPAHLHVTPPQCLNDQAWTAWRLSTRGNKSWDLLLSRHGHSPGSQGWSAVEWVTRPVVRLAATTSRRPEVTGATADTAMLTTLRYMQTMLFPKCNSTVKPLKIFLIICHNWELHLVFRAYLLQFEND